MIYTQIKKQKRGFTLLVVRKVMIFTWLMNGFQRLKLSFVVSQTFLNSFNYLYLLWKIYGIKNLAPLFILHQKHHVQPFKPCAQAY